MEKVDSQVESITKSPPSLGRLQDEVVELWQQNRRLMHLIQMILTREGSVIFNPEEVDGYAEVIAAAKGHPAAIKIEETECGGMRVSQA